MYYLYLFQIILVIIISILVKILPMVNLINPYSLLYLFALSSTTSNMDFYDAWKKITVGLFEI